MISDYRITQDTIDETERIRREVLEVRPDAAHYCEIDMLGYHGSEDFYARKNEIEAAALAAVRAVEDRASTIRMTLFFLFFIAVVGVGFMCGRSDHQPLSQETEAVER